MESALYFSLPEETAPGDEDGVLTAWEIVDSLTTDADLVVLSACRTARGRVIPGEGTIGLARAFQVAGARTLVASQWDVDDRSTAELMTAFYANLEAGASTVEALRRARLQLAAEHPELAHPFHWASFEVRGDWR
jgi:CHAT domain-containing protein